MAPDPVQYVSPRTHGRDRSQMLKFELYPTEHLLMGTASRRVEEPTSSAKPIAI
jgi:hypothetical protein